MKIKDTFCKNLTIHAAWIMLTVFLFSTAAFSGEEKTFVYFHSSETSINNFKSLKMEFDSYLSRFGPYELQPVKERSEFEKKIFHEKNCLILTSSWHYRKICGTYQGQPVLIGTRNGKSTQKRLLIAKTEFSDLASSGVNVASASSIQHTLSAIKEMFFNKKLNVDALKILTVPKDIDAMIAVSFDMSGAALISENNFDRLKLLTPVLYQKMKVIATGPEFHLMILAARINCLEKHKHLIQIIKEMSDTPLGQKQIRMLGLDGFQDVTDKDMMMLNLTKNVTWQQEKK